MFPDLLLVLSLGIGESIGGDEYWYHESPAKIGLNVQLARSSNNVHSIGFDLEHVSDLISRQDRGRNLIMLEYKYTLFD